MGCPDCGIPCFCVGKLETNNPIVRTPNPLIAIPRQILDTEVEVELHNPEAFDAVKRTIETLPGLLSTIVRRGNRFFISGNAIFASWAAVRQGYVKRRITAFDEYLRYVKNTGMNPLPISMFDEDHEPIGPSIREDMKNMRLIAEQDGGIVLT